MRWEFLIRSLKDFLWQGQQTIHLREEKKKKSKTVERELGEGEM